MQDILLSLKLVETFDYNSVYFHNGDGFFKDNVMDLWKCFILWYYDIDT